MGWSFPIGSVKGTVVRVHLTFLLLLGYAGWAPLQVEGEVAQGAWIPMPLHEDLVFEVEHEAPFTIPEGEATNLTLSFDASRWLAGPDGTTLDPCSSDPKVHARIMANVKASLRAFGDDEGGRSVLRDALDDLTDLPGEAVGLGDAADGRVGEAAAQERGELPVAVEALVVDFGDDDVLVVLLVERGLELRQLLLRGAELAADLGCKLPHGIGESLPLEAVEKLEDVATRTAPEALEPLRVGEDSEARRPVGVERATG